MVFSVCTNKTRTEIIAAVSTSMELCKNRYDRVYLLLVGYLPDDLYNDSKMFEGDITETEKEINKSFYLLSF